jgi:uncharacterized protein YjaG (DUF416 family)
MRILSYNEELLAADLDRLAVPLRVVFAAACAERLKPAYEKFSKETGRGNPAKLAAILSQLWEDLEGNELSPSQLQEGIESCMELIPQEDDGPWIPAQAVAEDAAAALAYALRCRQSGEAQEAAWSARRAYEAVDHFVISREGIDVNRAESERVVLSDPIVQSELSRQRRDLNELRTASTADVVERIRSRARSEAAHVFHSMS